MENTAIIPRGLSYHEIVVSILFGDNTYYQHLLNTIINAADRHDSLVPPWDARSSKSGSSIASGDSIFFPVAVIFLFSTNRPRADFEVGALIFLCHITFLNELHPLF